MRLVWCRCLFPHLSVRLSVLLQISPLRPQRPKSQVLNLIGGDRRLSVSPGPSSSTGPPPITPRTKLSFSLLTGSSKALYNSLSL